jgi:tRNA dimethylallyltransferase
VWTDLAADKINDIRGRGRVPIVCGGTFLWVRALLFGLAKAPPGDPNIRAAHKIHVVAEGRESLHRRLAEVDPKSAQRLHPNDFVRVSRALEVYELTGRPLSEVQEEHGFRQPRYRARLLAVGWQREEYEARVFARVRQMIETGFRPEVQELLERGYGDARAMAAVGYRQVKEAIEMDDRAISDTELTDSVVRATRIFARRQRTWLRDQPVCRIPSAVLEEPAEFARLVDELRTWLFDSST